MFIYGIETTPFLAVSIVTIVMLAPDVIKHELKEHNLI